MHELTVLVACRQPHTDDILELRAALISGGAAIVVASHNDIMGGLHDELIPQLVLMEARFSPEEVAELRARLNRAGHGPTPVVFCGSDHSPLDRHLALGMDYLVPPFSPDLVLNRLLTCRERHQLTTAAGEEEVLRLLRTERDLQIGREIQQGFLPAELPSPAGWDVAVRFEPAREVAGDFYDGFDMVNGRRLAYLVADVCDKGVGAALFMALIRSLLRHTARQRWAGALTPAMLHGPDLRLYPELGAAPLLAAVHGTNDYMVENHMRQAYFATLFFCVLDPASGAVTYINGGHNPPVVTRAGGGHELLQPTGPAVGLWPDALFEIGGTVLRPDDTLFAYTDGVTEAMDESGTMFTLGRLVDLLATGVDDGAEEIIERVHARVLAHMGSADQHDDITMLAIRRNGS
ncbi:PP2C family protein-serine/threonine phosphatase [Nonomuraea sp. LPB2021202275-12-8]|uniref:PP2C family protein-serine/threonine phosphatase n=1 Tax=Nonomuraea sp. LPB2021202275-12-8 TaxID=3120159 RepID=UPI00300C3BE7